jgi:hypothetical protein
MVLDFTFNRFKVTLAAPLPLRPLQSGPLVLQFLGDEALGF